MGSKKLKLSLPKIVCLTRPCLILFFIPSKAGLLVDAALNDLEPQKLVLFIQSFGIPVASMSKLLQKLDRIVEVKSNFL